MKTSFLVVCAAVVSASGQRNEHLGAHQQRRVQDVFLNLMDYAVSSTPAPTPVVPTPAPSVLKIFVLSGQSNMEGQGCENNLEYLVNTNPNDFGHLWDANSNDWSTRSDVSIRYYSEDQLKEAYSSLQACGMGVTDEKFGPETGIGWTLGDALQEHVLLLKISWGGKSLAVDFRPPNTPVSCADAGYTDCGLEFDKVVTYVQDTLANIADIVPNYASQFPGGYDLSGFVFFQGFNDVIDGAKVNEYKVNLEYFVQDMRTALNAPDLPFVIGELGMHGDLTNNTDGWVPRVQAIRDAQASVAAATSNCELAETAIYVETQEFPCTTSVLTGAKPCQCDGYHYYNNAYSYYNVGVSMGDSLLRLILP